MGIVVARHLSLVNGWLCCWWVNRDKGRVHPTVYCLYSVNSELGVDILGRGMTWRLFAIVLPCFFDEFAQTHRGSLCSVWADSKLLEEAYHAWLGVGVGLAVHPDVLI